MTNQRDFLQISSDVDFCPFSERGRERQVRPIHQSYLHLTEYDADYDSRTIVVSLSSDIDRECAADSQSKLSTSRQMLGAND